MIVIVPQQKLQQNKQMEEVIREEKGQWWWLYLSTRSNTVVESVPSMRLQQILISTPWMRTSSSLGFMSGIISAPPIRYLVLTKIRCVPVYKRREEVIREEKGQWERFHLVIREEKGQWERFHLVIREGKSSVGWYIDKIRGYQRREAVIREEKGQWEWIHLVKREGKSPMR